MRRMTRRMCALELSNGTTLEVTPEHRFFSNGEWTPIEELNVNDTLQLKDNSIVVIENKIIFPTFVEVYNLEIEDNENYYVTEEGVLVHNGYKKGSTPIKENEVTTYQDFFDRSVVGDGLEGHEVLQNSWLKKHGVISGPRLAEEASKKNPVIALPHDVHVNVNQAQRSLDVTSQTALENVNSNIKILKEQGIPQGTLDTLKEQAIKHIQDLGI